MKLGNKLKDALNDKFFPDHKYGYLTPGKAIRIYRELCGLSQNELASMTGLKQAIISSLENDRITLGIDRAKIIAKTLNVHPGVLALPTGNLLNR